MKCQGNFKFRSLGERSAGEFKNEKGVLIKYNSCYLLNVDEIKEDGVYTRQFKIAKDSPFLKELKDVELYQDIVIEFDIIIYRSNVTLVPIALVK